MGLGGMYDVCYATKDYNKAIPIVEKLVEFKDDYKRRFDIVVHEYPAV